MVKGTKFVLLCSASLALHAIPAAAQEAAAEPATEEFLGSGDIVVTATRRATALKDVPQSIQALSQDMLESRGVVDLESLGRQTPGLIMAENADRTPNVVIRGVGAFGNTQGVGYYIDDVQNFTDQTMLLQDVERIEILKGPQGTLYGGSSIGGAIRYITKQPEFDFGVDAMVEAGGYGFRNVYGAVNAPISADKIALRLSGYFTTDDGFWESPDFKDISNFEEYLVRGQMLFQPTDDLTIKLSGRYRSYKGAGLIGRAQDSIDQFIRVTDLSAKPGVTTDTYGFVGSVNYQAGDVEMDFITSYTQQDKDFLADVDYTTTAVPGIVIFTANPRPTKAFTNELRFTSTGNDRFDWIVGLYAARLNNANLTPSPLAAELSIPGVGVFLAIPDFSSYQAKQTDMAVFASSDLKLGNFTVTTGARLYHVDYDAYVFSSFGAPVNLKFRNNDTAILPRLAVSYLTAGGHNIYASVSRGYEPGKAALTSADPATYKPEKTWAFEVGSKGNIGGRSLYYEVAAFYTLYTDRQFETRIQDQATNAVFETIGNIGDSTAYGLEASLNWIPVKGLTLSGAVGYLHSEWDEGAEFNQVAIDGRQTPNAPEWTGNLGATYSTPVSQGLKVELHADASYTDEFRWGLGYQPGSSINPSHWLASASLSLSEIDDRWKISARVNNIFNERYFIDFLPENLGPQAGDGTCDQCHLGYIGDRRRLIISASTTF